MLHPVGPTIPVAPCNVCIVLGPGEAVPEARVWAATREGSVALADALGDGLVLLCFYLWDWSPT